MEKPPFPHLFGVRSRTDAAAAVQTDAARDGRRAGREAVAGRNALAATRPWRPDRPRTGPRDRRPANTALASGSVSAQTRSNSVRSLCTSARLAWASIGLSNTGRIATRNARHVASVENWVW